MNKLIMNILVAIVIIGIILFVVITSWQNYSSGFLSEIQLPFFLKEPVTTTTAAIILLSFVLGGLVGAVYVIKINNDCDDAIKFYKKKLNRITQNSDSDTALIDSLQRKISTLEIALENALRDKNN